MDLLTFTVNVYQTYHHGDTIMSSNPLSISFVKQTWAKPNPDGNSSYELESTNEVGGKRFELVQEANRTAIKIKCKAINQGNCITLTLTQHSCRSDTWAGKHFIWASGSIHYNLLFYRYDRDTLFWVLTKFNTSVGDPEVASGTATGTGAPLLNQQ